MDKKFLALISVFVIAFILFISIVAFNEPLKRFTSAREDIEPSPQSSLVFAWPLTSPVGQSIKIDVFVRSASGKPLSGKTVTVTTTQGSLNEPSLKTDKSGKASFALSSDQPGIAEVAAVVDGAISLDKKISIKFE